VHELPRGEDDRLLAVSPASLTVYGNLLRQLQLEPDIVACIPRQSASILMLRSFENWHTIAVTKGKCVGLCFVEGTNRTRTTLVGPGIKVMARVDNEGLGSFFHSTCLDYNSHAKEDHDIVACALVPD
jgi:hypothetical protein